MICCERYKGGKAMKKMLCVLLTCMLLLAVIPVSAAESEDALVVSNATKVSGAFFTRQFGNNSSDIDVREMLHGYNPIVWTSQLTFEPDPSVVEELTSEQVFNGRAYTFTLKDDLCWNDGTPITAKDYVFAFALQMSGPFEKIGGDTDVWQHIVGYERYLNGRDSFLSGVHLIDERSFSVTVKQEYLPYFYEYAYLAIAPCPIDVIAPGCTVADDGQGVYIKNADETAAEPIFSEDLLKKTITDEKNGYLSHPFKTCGPYSLVTYDKESGTVEFKANPRYKGDRDGAKPTVERVKLIYTPAKDIPDKLKNGEIDIVNKMVSKDLIDTCLDLKDESKVAVGYPRLGYGYIALACEKGPQQFMAVRQAIAYAIDADAFVEERLGNYGMTSLGFYGLGQWMTQAALGSLRVKELPAPEAARWDSLTLDELNRYDINTDTALDLLVRDGWTWNANGKRFDPEKDSVRYKKVNGKLMPLSFHFGLTEDNDNASAILEYLKNGLEPLGAEIIVTEDSFPNIFADYMRENGERQYDMSFLAYNFSAIYDPYVEIFYSNYMLGSQNAMGISDRMLLKLAENLHRTPSGNVTEYLTRWIAFQKRYNKVLPSIPLYTGVYYDLYPAELEGYDPVRESGWPQALLRMSLKTVKDQVKK